MAANVNDINYTSNTLNTDRLFGKSQYKRKKVNKNFTTNKTNPKRLKEINLKIDNIKKDIVNKRSDLNKIQLELEYVLQTITKFQNVTNKVKKEFETEKEISKRLLVNITQEKKFQKTLLNRKSENIDDCTICMNDSRKFALIPCGHFGFCSNCVGRLEECPYCKEEIKEFIKIYIP